jgi:cytochrome P450
MAQDEESGTGMSDKQLRDELITIFGAGHETTAATLSWVWYILATHPDVEAKLHAEIDTVLQGRPPKMEDLSRLSYTGQIIKEAMRLYPPAFGGSRESTTEVEIGGVHFPKGVPFFLNFYGMHRDSRFFANPEVFDAERFSVENEKSIDKNAYLPFGSGPRVCIGNAFAMMEARLLLATLAQQYRLTLPADMVVEPARRFALRPRYGLRMVAHKR